MGYYPFGSRFFSGLVHCVHSRELVISTNMPSFFRDLKLPFATKSNAFQWRATLGAPANLRAQ
jgi:hypothetical protein